MDEKSQRPVVVVSGEDQLVASIKSRLGRWALVRESAPSADIQIAGLGVALRERVAAVTVRFAGDSETADFYVGEGGLVDLVRAILDWREGTCHAFNTRAATVFCWEYRDAIFSVEHGGGYLSGRGQTARLFHMLHSAGSDGRAQRDLIAAFWPGDLDRGTARLRDLLSELRKVVEPGASGEFGTILRQGVQVRFEGYTLPSPWTVPSQPAPPRLPVSPEKEQMLLASLGRLRRVLAGQQPATIQNAVQEVVRLWSQATHGADEPILSSMRIPHMSAVCQMCTISVSADAEGRCPACRLPAAYWAIPLPDHDASR